jgi:excinuclease UvrABC nuclease subunit
MPFPMQGLHPFSEENIVLLAPDEPGVYGIFNADKWIYVGQAQDVKQRLLQDVRKESDQSACIFENEPTHWIAVARSAGDLDAAEKDLIKEYKPVCK